jgi:translation initiation factor 2B subunit (eIF-2B alpha/beta/delta family)
MSKKELLKPFLNIPIGNLNSSQTWQNLLTYFIINSFPLKEAKIMQTKVKQISICKMVFHSKISNIMTMCDKINCFFAQVIY